MNIDRAYKEKISKKLQEAVRMGIVVKPDTCEMCHQQLPKNKIHGHHEDYSKPLEVKWVCSSCHARITNKDYIKRFGIPKYGSTIGDKNGFSKLTVEDVREIRRLLKPEPLTLREIGQMYGVAMTTIWRIKKGVDWNKVF